MFKRMGKVLRIEQTTCSWEEALQGFLFWKQAQGLSKVTLNGYKETISCFFHRFPCCWQTGNLKQSVMSHMSDNIKPATYNIRLIYLKAFFEWSIKEGYLDSNPLQGFRKRKADARIVNIPDDTLQSLLKLPDQSTFAGLRDFALILFTLDTGIRPKEAFNLTIYDLDLRRLVVTIPAQEAKTRISRCLPILPLTAEAINRLIRARHPAWSKDAPVFCSSEGTCLSRYTWGDRMEMYSKILGVKIRPYDLRHCFALLYLRNGGHAFALQKTLGHTDMSMTKRYVSLTGQDLQEIHRIASPLRKLISTTKRTRRINVVSHPEEERYP